MSKIMAYEASGRPNYSEMIKFLILPFLESPESFSVDCEQCKLNQRVWVRLAFEIDDKGKVYGRGGRNLQAIRNVLETAATTVGQSIYLEVYESEEQQRPRRRPNIPTVGEPLLNEHRPLRKQRSRSSITPRFNPFPE